MGREIRRVPPKWEHPRYTADNAPRNSLRSMIGEYIPMFDQDYDSAATEWIAANESWNDGTHEDCEKYRADYMYYWDWSGNPPDSESYRPAFTDEPTWCQGYETVSEGTPFTPAFETTAELVVWLVENGDPVHGAISKEQAESFVSGGYAPSMVMTVGESGADIRGGIQAL